MPRARNPNRDKAYEIWLEHGSEITNRKIAEMLGEDEKVVAVWKQRDKWKVVQQSFESCTTNDDVPRTRSGQPAKRPHMIGNQRAKGGRGNPNPRPNCGNKGGAAPKGNSNAVTHGFFRRYFPDDDEVQELLEEIDGFSTLDMLWISIKTKFAAIIRAQKLMFVIDQEDMTKEVGKSKRVLGDMEIEETEYVIQFAWDKHATYLNAQARAMSELRSLIKDFEAQADATDKRLLELKQMRLNITKTEAEIEKLKGGSGGEDDKAKAWVEATKRMAERRKKRGGESK